MGRWVKGAGKLNYRVLVIPNHRAVSLNKIYSQTHWRARQALKSRVHDLVRAYVPAIDKRVCERRVDVEITAYFRGGRIRDSDNIAAKLYIDGLRGIFLEDDDTRFVRKVTVEAVIKAKEDQVIIKLIEL